MKAEDQITILKALQAIETLTNSVKVTTLLGPTNIGVDTIIENVRAMKYKLSVIENIITPPLKTKDSLTEGIARLQNLTREELTALVKSTEVLNNNHMSTDPISRMGCYDEGKWIWDEVFSDRLTNDDLFTVYLLLRDKG